MKTPLNVTDLGIDRDNKRLFFRVDHGDKTGYTDLVLAIDDTGRLTVMPKEETNGDRQD